jgi:hypothetical protein
MKKIVLTFGALSGGLLSAMMLTTLGFADQIGFDKGAIIGYTTMVLASLLTFFGIRSYRENVGKGFITFGRAFAVGILITLVAAAFYVATWELIYYKLKPGFTEKYAAYVVEKARAGGASQREIDAKTEEMRNFKIMYDKPLVNIAFTFLEVFPIGAILSLISAAILRKKRVAEPVAAPA